MSGLAVVTGANRGIGLELTRQLHRRGQTVVAACRSGSDALRDVGCEVIDGVDVASDAGVRALCDGLAGRPIDLLINNAGVLRNDPLDDLDFDQLRLQFEVNTLGPLRVTAALAPALSQGAKVAIVTSRMGSIADNTSGGRYGYRMSKAAVNMAGVSLAHDLAPRGISVALLHPGFVRTEMTSGQGLLEADAAAEGLIARIDALDLETSGSFWHSNGEALPW